MIGLIRPDQGEVLYDGRDLIKMTKPELLRLRREIGMLFQGSALFDSMTVVENVLFPMEMFSSAATTSPTAVRWSYWSVSVWPKLRRSIPAEISGGMMKRTAIARALALNPKYLFCDEPNSGLDPNDLYGHRPAHLRAHARVQYHDHRQYARHELRACYR